MKLKDMSKEELELLSYTDLTERVLKESNGSMNTPTVFRKICDLLEYSDDQYVAKIGDYYTSLTIDKRFVLLDNNEWDLRDRHRVSISLDEEDEEEILDEEEVEEAPEEEEEENIDETENEDELDVDDEDDLEELNIVTDDEEDMD